MSAPIVTVPLLEAMQIHFVLENKRDMLTPSERKTLLAVENLLKLKTESSGRYGGPPNVWTQPDAPLCLEQGVTYMKFKELREVAKSMQPGGNAARFPSAYRLAVYAYNKLSSVGSIFTASSEEEKVAGEVDASAFRAFMVTLKGFAHKSRELNPEARATRFIQKGLSSEQSSVTLSADLHADLAKFFKEYDLCLNTYRPVDGPKPQFWDNVRWSNSSDSRSQEQIYINETKDMTDVTLNSTPDMLQRLLQRLNLLLNDQDPGAMPEDFQGGELGLGRIDEITFTAEKEKVLLRGNDEGPAAFVRRLPPQEDKEVIRVKSFSNLRAQFLEDFDKFSLKCPNREPRQAFWDKVSWADGTAQNDGIYKDEPTKRQDLLKRCTVSGLRKVLARLEDLKSSDSGETPEKLTYPEQGFCTITVFSFKDDAAKQAFLKERIQFVVDLIPLMERYEAIVDQYTKAIHAKAVHMEAEGAAARKQLLQNRIQFVENLIALSDKHDASLFDQVRDVQASTPVVSEISLPKAMSIHFVLAKKSEELTQEERKTLAVVENVLSQLKDSWSAVPGRVLRVREINEAQFSELEEAAKSTKSRTLIGRAYRMVVYVRNQIFDSELLKNIWPNKISPLGIGAAQADDAVFRDFFVKVDNFFAAHSKISSGEGAAKLVETLLDNFIISYVNPTYKPGEPSSGEGIPGYSSSVRVALKQCAEARRALLAKYTTQYQGNPKTDPELFWYALTQRAPGTTSVRLDRGTMLIGDSARFMTDVKLKTAPLNLQLWEQEQKHRTALLDQRLNKERLEVILRRLEGIQNNNSPENFSDDTTPAEKWLGSIDSIDVVEKYSWTYPLDDLLTSRVKFVRALMGLSDDYDRILGFAKEIRELELAQPEPAEKQQELV